jgi:hypothetical protein
MEEQALKEAVQKLDTAVVSSIFRPKIEAVVNRLINIEAGQTVNFQPIEGYTAEQYVAAIRRGLGDHPDAKDRRYYFKGNNDNVIITWEPVKAPLPHRMPYSGKTNWGPYVRVAAALKEGESHEFTIPENKDVASFKTNLATTLGHNAKETKNWRWGIVGSKDSRVVTVTRYGLRSETPAPIRPQNQPHTSDAIDLPAVKLKPQIPSSVPSSYGSVVAMLEQKRIVLMEEVSKLDTAIEVLKSLA